MATGVPLPSKGIGCCFAVCRPQAYWFGGHHNYYFSKQSERLSEQVDATRGLAKSKKNLHTGVRRHPRNFSRALLIFFLYNYYYKMI